jgi:hypothetical protein
VTAGTGIHYAITATATIIAGLIALIGGWLK